MGEQEPVVKTAAPDILSVGVEIRKDTRLVKINQLLPLSKVIEEICSSNNIQDSEEYGLQFDDHPTLSYSYITEENRREIINGSVCKLVYAPANLVKKILAKMVSPGNEENIWSLKKVLWFMNDKAFVEKFVEVKGVTILVTVLQGNALSSEATGYALKCTSELLSRGYVPIESIKDRILDKVIRIILNRKEGTPEAQEACLSITNTLLELHPTMFAEIYQTVSVEKVIHHLMNENFWVQHTALGLINAIFSGTNALQRKFLIKAHALQIRDVIFKYIIHRCKKNIPTKMMHQLAIFQFTFLTRLRRKAESAVDMEDNVVKKRIKNLSRLSMEDGAEAAETAKRRNTFVETTLNLLSDYRIPPPIDASELPPSILVLDCMTHFTKTYHTNYTKAVLEHAVKTAKTEYPFVQLCSELVTLLTDALGITGNPKQYAYHPVLFSCDNAFEELFCACIMVFSKTSKEMRARSEDFKKVLNVVKKKVEVALGEKPINLKEYDSLFYQVTYQDVSNIWQKELQCKEQLDLKEKKSLLEMKQDVKADFMSLIEKHRLHALTKGAYFPKFSRASRMKNRFWFVKYIPSEKVFEFCDEEEKFNDFRLELSKIKNIVTEQNCPHVKLRGQKLVPENAFSLVLTEVEPNNFLNLSASNERQLHHVLDGFRVLLGHPMTSPACTQDLQELTDMYMRLELLDAHGVELPSGDAPPIPPDPPNYDFLPVP